MLKPDYEHFLAIISPFLPKDAAQKDFKRLLGQALYALTDDPNEHQTMVLKAIDISGEKPGKQRVGDDYGVELVKNYRKGVGSQKVALGLYYWLLKMPDTAERPYSLAAKKLNTHLFGCASFEERFDGVLDKLKPEHREAPAWSWMTFLEQYGQFKEIDVVIGRETSGFDIVDLDRDEPVHDETIPLGTPFRFKLRIRSKGMGLALQYCKEKTYPLRYSHAQMVYRSPGQDVFFPDPQAIGARRYLVEHHDDTPHQFIFVVVSHHAEAVLIRFANRLKTGTAINQPDLDQWAEDLSSTLARIAIRRINISFRGNRI